MSRALLFAFLFVPFADARAGDKTAEKMKVTLVAILGSEGGASTDPRLKDIAEEIKKREPLLKSFKIYSMTNRDLAVRDKTEFALVDGKSAQVAIKHAIDENDKVAVGVTAPDQKEIVYRAVCGKFVPIMTSYETKDRQRLILAVRVEMIPAK